SFICFCGIRSANFSSSEGTLGFFSTVGVETCETGLLLSSLTGVEAPESILRFWIERVGDNDFFPTGWSGFETFAPVDLKESVAWPFFCVDRLGCGMMTGFVVCKVICCCYDCGLEAFY